MWFLGVRNYSLLLGQDLAGANCSPGLRDRLERLRGGRSAGWSYG